MTPSVQVQRFGSLGPPKGPRRTPTSLSPTLKKEVVSLIDALTSTARLVEGPKKGGPKVFKVTMGANGSEYTVQMNMSGGMVATRSDGQVVIDMFNNTWNFGAYSFGYTNKANPSQNVVTPDEDVMKKAKALYAKLNALSNPEASSPGFDV